MKAYLAHARRGVAVIGGNLANFGLTLARNKLIALSFGPVGVGWIALVNNLIETAAVVGGMGVCDALNRELPRDGKGFTKADMVSSGIGLFLLTLVLAIPVSTWLFLSTAHVKSHQVLLGASFALAAVLASLWRVLGGVFLGLGISRRMFWTIVAGGASNLAFAALFLGLGIHQLMAYVVMTPALLAICGLVGLWPQLRLLVDWKAVRWMPARRPILVIALPIVAGLLLEPTTILALRSETAARFGEEGVGFIQPGMLFVILAASLANAFLGMTLARWDQSSELAFSKRFMVLLAASVALPAVGIAVLRLFDPLWPFFVKLFFSERFLLGVDTIPWFISGELLRMGGIMLNHTLLSRNLGYLTLLPRMACLGTALFVIQSGRIDSIVAVGQTYAVAYGAYLGLSIALWLGAQLWFRRAQAAGTGLST